MKIIKIDGFKGLFTAAFIVCCLFAGFVISPGYVAMHLWNKYLVNLFMFPQLNLFQGVLLWGIVFLSYYIVVKGVIPVSFESPKELSDAELNMIMKNARAFSQMQKRSSIVQKSDKFEKTIQNNPFNSSNSDNLSNISTQTTKSDEDENKISNLK